MMIFVMLVACMCAFNAEAATPRDDSAYIQNLIDTATPGHGGVKTVTIPSVNPNDPYGGSVYQIGNAIELPSKTTVKLDNCTLRLNDGVLCNIFISKGCYNSSMSASQELTDISIIGIGNAVLDGGVHNGVTEKTGNSPLGFSKVRYNTSIHFRNVNGFKVSGITVKEPRYWGMTYIYCRNGEISDITFDCSNDAPNQDGIDLRIGCNNIDISGITGVTGDDAVALTALSGGSDLWFGVQGKSSDIHDVSIDNVRATCVGGHGIVRLLCHHGHKIYNVDIKNIEDIGTNHVQGVLRIGDTNYAGSGTPMQYGDIHSITVDGVISNGKCAVYAPNIKVTSAHVTYKNVTVKYQYGMISTLIDDSYRVEPLSSLRGCPIYSFEGGSTVDWTYNNNDIRTASGTLNGVSDSYTMWPIGPTRPAGGVPLTLTAAINQNTSSNSELHAQLVMAHLPGTDPAPELLKMYYSTDNGQSWSAEPISLTVKCHGGIWALSASTVCNVWSFTTENLAELTDKSVTSLKVMPYGDNSFAVGAFRLISLTLTGDHNLTHYDAVPATCVQTGQVERWSCSNCNKNFANASCTSVWSSIKTPADKVNGHSVSEVGAQAPTETENGWEAHYQCTLCNRRYSDAQGKNGITLNDVTLPATGGGSQDQGEAQPPDTPSNAPATPNNTQNTPNTPNTPATDDTADPTAPDDGQSGEKTKALPLPLVFGIAAATAVASVTVILLKKRRK